jgi:transposase-like protein
VNLSDPIFSDADASRNWLEAQRWPDGRVCPHCGNSDQDKIGDLKGKAHRAGLFQCGECREQFTVQVGTVMESSHIPLNKWLAAMFLMASSKKGVSAAQVSRTLGLPYKTSWFLCHRIRKAMEEDVSSNPMGGAGKIVEADETYYGPTDKKRKVTTSGRPFLKGGRHGSSNKRTIVALVERGGKVRSFHVETATANSVREILVRNVSRDTVLHTDESKLYVRVGEEFAAHSTVNHSKKEYVRGAIHTNTIENTFSVFKRGMRGVYQHCGEAHLHRYLAEFDFRYNRRSALGVTDTERTAALVRNAEGKRLVYERLAPTKIP